MNENEDLGNVVVVMPIPAQAPACLVLPLAPAFPARAVIVVYGPVQHLRWRDKFGARIPRAALQSRNANGSLRLK